MFCEAFITIAGWICKEPVFTVTKQGTPYCSFMIATTNNSKSNDEILRFSCFLWQGQQYNLIKQMNLTIKDEIVVRGQFSTTVKNGAQGPIHNLQCYVNYIKVIRSSAAQKAFEELNADRQITQLKKVNKNQNMEVGIDKNDNPWG